MFCNSQPLCRILTVWLLVALACGEPQLQAASLYWDTNGSSAGSANSTLGVWGSSNFWNTDSTGAGAGVFGSTTTLGDTLFISAGTAATGANTLTLQGTQVGGSLVFSTGVITLSGSAALGGTLTLGTGGMTVASTVNGAVTLDSTLSRVSLAGSQTWTNNSASSLTTSGSTVISGTAAAGTTNILTVAGSSAGGMTLTGQIENGAGGGSLALTKSGTNTVTLAGSNTYTGATSVSQGPLRLSNSNALGGGGAVTVTSGARLELSGGVTISGNTVTINGNGGNLFGALSGFSGNNTWAGGVILGSTAARIGVQTGTLNITGVISGSSGFQLVSRNANTVATDVVIYSGANTFDGPFLVGTGNASFGTLNSVNTSALLGTVHSSSSHMGAPTTVSNGAIAIGSVGTSARLIYTGTGEITDRQLQISSTSTATLDQSGSGLLKFITDSTTTGAGNQTFVLQGSTSGTGEFAGAIVNNSGTNVLSLTKAGTGLWTLSGSNSYTGTTTVSAGTLALGSSNALAGGGSIKFTGGTLQFGSTNTTDYSARILSSTSAIALDTNGQNVTFSGSLAASNTGGLTKLGSGTLTLSGSSLYTGTTTVSGGTLTLLTNYASSAFSVGSGAALEINSGTTALSLSTATFSGSGVLRKIGSSQLIWGTSSATFAMSSGALIDVQAGQFVGGGNGNEVWTSNLADLNVASGANFYGGEANVRVNALSGSGGIQSGFSGAGYTEFTFGVNDGSGTFSGVLADATTSGNYKKMGTGTQTLSGSNTFSGTLTLGAGTVALGNANALGGGGTLKFSGGTLQFSSANSVDYGARIQNSGSAIGLDTNNQSVVFAGTLNASNTGGLMKTGAGMLTLNGLNAYTGSTTINAGTLKIGTSGKIYAGGYNGSTPLTVNAGGTLEISNWGYGGALGGLSAGKTLLVLNGGTIQMNGSTNYDRGFTVLGGGATFLSASGVNWVMSLNDQNDGDVVSYSGNPTLTFGGSGNGKFDKVFSGSGGLIKIGAGSWSLSQPNTYTGTTQVMAGTLAIAHSNALAGGGSITFGGGLLQFGTSGTTLTNTITGSGTAAILVDTNAFDGVWSGNMDSTNTGGLTKRGLGTLSLSGSNGYTGVTTLSGGTVVLGNANALGGGGSITFGGGLLQFGTSGIILSNTITGSGTAAILVDTNGLNGVWSGNMDSTNTGGLTKRGSGTLSLSGSNGYTGITTLSGGTLALGNTHALGGGGSITFGGGALQFGSANTGDYAARIQNSGSAIILDTNGQAVVFAGSLNATNTGGLAKNGLGMLTLSGTNTYTGTTAVNAGTLTAGGAQAFAGMGSVEINGGLLNLSGQSLSMGSLTLFSGGSLQLGAGQLVASTGAVALNGSINVSGSVSAATIGRYTLLSGSSLSGTFQTDFLPDNTAYYLKTSGTSLLLQRFAEVGTVTATPTQTSIITGGSTTVQVVVGNSAPSLSDSLSVVVTGSSNTSGTVSGSGILAGGTGVVSGLSFSGTAVGAAQTGVFRVTGQQSSNGPVDGTVSVNVYDHASAVLSSGTLTLNVREGYGSPIVSSNTLSLSNLSGYRVNLSGSGTTTGGVSVSSASGLAAGQSSAISATLGTGVSAGSLNRSITYTFADDSALSGASANLGTATIQVNGGVYRKAVGAVSSSTLSLGAIREGGTFGQGTVTVSNTASNDGYSDDLAAVISGLGNISGSGSVARIAGGSLNSGSLSVGYTGGTTSAGVVSGTATVSYTSVGQIGTGLTDVAPDVASQSIAVSGAIYRLASGTLSSGTLNLGNIRAGSVFGSGTVSVSNTASADGYSDSLRVSQSGGSSGFTIVGGTQTLAAGGSGSYSIGFASSNTSAGVQSGTVNFGYTSVGQTGTGLSDVALSGQSLNVFGTVYRSGSGVLGSTSVNLGNIREGGTFGTGGVSVSNGAESDGFSEKLNVTVSGTSGGATGSGSVSLLEAGSTASNVVQVGLSNGTSAGAKTGTVTVQYETSGTGTSGLASEVVGNGTVSVSGTVYRKAVGAVSSSTLSLGAIREGGTFGQGTVTVSNTASNDGFSDDLAAAISGLGNISGSGSVARIAGGSLNSGSLSVGYTGGTSSAGAVSGTATVSYTSVGQIGTGLADVATDVASQSIAVSGAIYRLASGTLSATAVDLGRIHAGSAFTTAAVQLTNTASNDGYSDLLQISPITDPASMLKSGTAQTLWAGQSSEFTFGYDVTPSTVGLIEGTVSFGLTSKGQTGTGLTNVALSAASVRVSGTVYTGNGVWAGGATGSWSDWANWTLNGGRPGLDGDLSRGNDTATFQSASAINVNLPGQLVELRRLDLLGTGGVQISTVNPTDSGLAFSGSAQIYAAGGSHAVNAPVILQQTTAVTVETGATLTLGGVLSGDGGFTKLGAGTLFLSSANTYKGDTTVSSGCLELGLGALPGPGLISLAEGTTIAFHLNGDLTLPNSIVGLGKVVSLDPRFAIFWNGGAILPPTGNMTVAPGEMTDFVRSKLPEDGMLYVNSGTLMVKQPEGGEIGNRAVIQGSASFAIQSDTTFGLSGEVSGSGKLIKEDLGTMVLSGSNTYSGGTEVRSGTLKVTDGNALGSAGVLVLEDARLLFKTDSEMTLNNNMSGPGALIKTGASTLTLTGSNSILWTRIQEGTVAINSGAAIGDRLIMAGGTLSISGHDTLAQQIQFESSSVITVTDASATNFAGNVSGSGDFMKRGAGALTLSGSGELTGHVVVQQGTLRVDRSEPLSKSPLVVVGDSGSTPNTAMLDVSGLSGGLLVASGQTLKGNGMVLGSVRSAGSAVFHPGNSPGQQTFTGDVTLAASDRYEVDYLTTFANTGYVVAGSFALNGATTVLSSWAGTSPTRTGTARVNDFAAHTFTIATAAGGISGVGDVISEVQVDGVAYSSALLPARLTTAGTALLATVQRLSFENIGLNGNNRKFARMLDAGVGNATFGFIDQLDKQESLGNVRALIGTANPAGFAELANLGLGRAMEVQKAVANRAVALSLESLDRRNPNGSSDFTAWTTGYAASQNRSAEASIGTAGFSGTSAGDVTGVEKRLGPVTLGISGAAGTSSASFGSNVGRVSGETWHGGFYGVLPIGKVVLDAGATYGFARNEVKRDLSGAGGRLSRTLVENTEHVLQLGISAPMRLRNHSILFVPNLHLIYSGYHAKDANESDNGGLEAKVGSGSAAALLSKAGVHFGKEMRFLGKAAKLGGTLDWIHNFNRERHSVDVSIGGAPGLERFESSKAGSDALKIGVYGEVILSDRVSLLLNLDHQVQDGQRSTYSAATVRYQF